MNSLQIGDSVSWMSAAGYKEGKIKNVVLSKNANDKLIPWIDIEFRVAKDVLRSVRLCATERHMEMMQVIKL